MECRKHEDKAVEVFMLGDLNVHSIRWLTHPARGSVEGRLLCDISHQLWLHQLVKDLFAKCTSLTDVPDCTARPGAAVADHKGVLTQVRFKIKEIASHNREVWHFSEADWERLPGSRFSIFWGWHVLDRIRSDSYPFVSR